MIVVVSNREVNESANDENVFGEKVNPKGVNELRLAAARYDEPSERWFLDLKPEVEGETSPPSEVLFKQVVKDINEDKIPPHWLVYVHGFNQNMRSILDWCRDMETNYRVNVLAFAWPSNQGGLVWDEYRTARRIAQASDTALDRVFELLGKYMGKQPQEDRMQCPVKLSLLFYSLGGFLAESLFRSPLHTGETSIFDNVVFLQADVDSRSHAEWIDKIDGRRTYVTLNADDRVLRKSDVINSTRLGQRLRGDRGDEPFYVDFTDGRGVGDAHNLLKETRLNLVIQSFWRRVLVGKAGEVVEGISFDPSSQTYRLDVLDIA